MTNPQNEAKQKTVEAEFSSLDMYIHRCAQLQVLNAKHLWTCVGGDVCDDDGDEEFAHYLRKPACTSLNMGSRAEINMTSI